MKNSRKFQLSHRLLFVVYIHDLEDKMLISLGNPPIEITRFNLFISQDSEFLGTEVSINEKHVTLMNKKSSKCKQYQPGEVNFNACSKQFVDSYFKKNVNCTLAGKNMFIQPCWLIGLSHQRHQLTDLSGEWS